MLHLRKKLSALLVCCSLSSAVLGQTDEPTVNVYDSLNTSFEAQMDHVFANLDLSAVTTNLLLYAQTSPGHLKL